MRCDEDLWFNFPFARDSLGTYQKRNSGPLAGTRVIQEQSNRAAKGPGNGRTWTKALILAAQPLHS